MADVFPSLNIQYPILISPRWNTLVNSFEGGMEERRQLWLYPVHDVVITITGLTLANSQTLYAFYMAQKGRLTSFWFFDPFIFGHVGVWICTGDGILDTFDLPVKGISGYSIYDNGIELSESADYSILSGGGAGNSDRIEFVNPVSSGHIITADFYGYRRFYVRFMDDTVARKHFTLERSEYSLNLLGVKEVSA